MSDAEIGSINLPPFGVYVPEQDGAVAWEPRFKAVRVEEIANGGKRLTVATCSADLTKEVAEHIAALLLAKGDAQ